MPEMNIAVEAASLSTITEIASNPPQHPSESVHPSRLPLVLYIARIPGSRDVFLTPIKPREKVVTAEDVQSSLYYVHINNAEDFDEDPQVETDNASQLLAIREDSFCDRPPLPARPIEHAPLIHSMSNGVDCARQNPSVPPRKAIVRKPVGTDTPDRKSLEQKSSTIPVLPPRPLPQPPDGAVVSSDSLHVGNMRLLRDSDHSEENNPYLRTYEPPSGPLVPSEMPEPGSLTLIRRDPASNEQWNVASIHDPPALDVSSAAILKSSATKRTKRGGKPLYLDISNPAYRQFLANERSDSRFSSSTSASSESDPAPSGVFRRRLYMPGSRFSEHGYDHSRASGSFGSRDVGRDFSTQQTMRHSVGPGASYTSFATADRSSKGYTFNSPWDGRCEFSTGATGRSLKCRHYLPADLQNDVVEVSELRFNLPTTQSKTATAISEKRSSYFHRLHGRSLSTDGDIEIPEAIFDEDGRLDVTLGQERAGGGFGGKQAKLGKLIIEPEGLKMVDLLVAANIGLWWRAYERS